jgi:hypothetical protein
MGLLTIDKLGGATFAVAPDLKNLIASFSDWADGLVVLWQAGWWPTGSLTAFGQESIILVQYRETPALPSRGGRMPVE